VKQEIGATAVVSGSLMVLGAILSTIDVASWREDRVFDIYFLFNLGTLVGLYLLVFRPLLLSYQIDRTRRRRGSTTSTLDDVL